MDGPGIFFPSVSLSESRSQWAGPEAGGPVGALRELWRASLCKPPGHGGEEGGQGYYRTTFLAHVTGDLGLQTAMLHLEENVGRDSMDEDPGHETPPSPPPGSKQLGRLPTGPCSVTNGQKRPQPCPQGQRVSPSALSCSAPPLSQANRWAWPCANETLLTKAGRGPGGLPWPSPLTSALRALGFPWSPCPEAKHPSHSLRRVPGGWVCSGCRTGVHPASGPWGAGQLQGSGSGLRP